MKRIIHCIGPSTKHLDSVAVSYYSLQCVIAATASCLVRGRILEYNGFIVAKDGDGYSILGTQTERFYDSASNATHAWMNIHAYS